MKRNALLICAMASLCAAMWGQSSGAANGTLKLSAANAELRLKTGGGPEVTVQGGSDATLAPGVYTPLKLVLSKRQVKEEAGKKTESKWELTSAGVWGDLAKITVSEGQSTTITLGEPLTVKTDVSTGDDGTVSFGLRILGADHEAYAPYATKDGKPISVPPKVTILDESGKVLNTGSFQFGWGGVCRYSWRVPTDFKGKYQVKVEADLGPFEWKSEDAWHEIK